MSSHSSSSSSTSGQHGQRLHHAHHPMACKFPRPRVCDYECIPWALVRSLIDSNDLYQLGRSLDATSVYVEYMAKVRAEWKTIKDFILVTKFGFPLKSRSTSNSSSSSSSSSSDIDGCKKEADDSLILDSSISSSSSSSNGHPLQQEQDKILILDNDFPYNFEGNVKHFIIWKLGGRAITKEEAELHGKSFFDCKNSIKPGSVTDWTYFINPPELKSIPEIDHAHLLVQYSKEEETFWVGSRGS